jgi:hypothetical protein
MDGYPVPPKLRTRRRNGRRKGEKPVKVYGTEQLFEMFQCNDVDVLLEKLAALGINPHVSNGPNNTRLVFISNYQLPPEFPQP